MSGCTGHKYTQCYSNSAARNFLSHSPYYVGPCIRRCKVLLLCIVLLTIGAMRGHRHSYLKVAYRVPKDGPYNKTSWNAHRIFWCTLKRLQKMLTELIYSDAQTNRCLLYLIWYAIDCTRDNSIAHSCIQQQPLLASSHAVHSQNPAISRPGHSLPFIFQKPETNPRSLKILEVVSWRKRS